MTTLRQAAEQALEALQIWQDSLTDPSAIPGWRFSVVGEKAIANLRAALAEDAMQRLTDVQQDMESACQESRQVEPVAYVTGYSKGYATVKPIDPCLLMCVGMALYRSPSKFKKLTDEDIAELCTRYGVGYPPVVSPYTRRLIKAVEQKLMEKNKS